jgi:transcription elongation GreA/GreB family factor
MEQEITQLIKAGKLTQPEADTLLQLTPGTACLHKSWGFGRVAELSPLLNQITIDFRQKRGHTMQLPYAAQTVQPLPAEHILARVDSDRESVRKQATEDPVELLRSVLNDLGGAATQDQIASLLTQGLFTPEEFKKWWTGAKKRLTKHGHFDVPTAKNAPIRLRDEPLSRGEELISAFRNSRNLKDQITALDALVREVAAVADEKPALQAVVTAASDSAAKTQKLHTSQALELLISRDELVAAAGLEPAPAPALRVADILRSAGPALSSLLSEISASKLKKALAEFPNAFGDAWTSRAVGLLGTASHRVIGEVAKLMASTGNGEEFFSAIERTIRERSASSDLLYWLCKSRGAEFDRLSSPGLLGAILAVLERDQLSEGRKSGRLHDLVIEDLQLVPELLSAASRDEVREVMRRLLMTTVFEELNKRSLFGRIIKAHPEMQSMLTGGGEEEKQEALIVSWSSLERRKKEYEELVNKKIPENSKDISIARSYGDLRENFEYKSAKEMQAVLLRRKAELEQMLSAARGTAFEDPDTSQVGIGTVVTLEELPEGTRSEYMILGAWDSDPEKHVLSYQTAIGQALLGKKPGEEADLTTDHGPRHVRILQIRAFKPGVDYPI